MKQNKKSLIMIALISALPALSFAAVDGPHLTIKDALKKGIENSPEVKQAQGAVSEAENTTDKARTLVFPTINAVAAGTNSQTGSTFASSFNSSVSSRSGDVYQAGLTLSQPLYAGGAITGGINFYKSGEDLAKQSLFLAKQTLVYNLLSSYFTLVQQELSTRAAQDNRDILKAYVDITAHYANIGRARHMDELQAQANYSLALVDVEQNLVALKNAQAGLNRYMYEKPDSPIGTDFHVVVTPIGNLSTAEALEAAVKANPTIRTAQLTREQIDYTEDIDFAADHPSLNLVGDAGYQAPDVPSLWQNSSEYYSIGINLTIPLFSGLSSVSKGRIYGNKKYEQEKAIETAKLNVRLQIEQALANLRSTQTQVDISHKSTKQAQVALSEANTAYRRGTASSQDVINNQTTRYNAEKSLVTTQVAYIQALLTLRQSMGVDLEKAYEE